MRKVVDSKLTTSGTLLLVRTSCTSTRDSSHPRMDGLSHERRWKSGIARAGSTSLKTATVAYGECKACGTLKRKERVQRSPGAFNVHSFTVENMGVYQRAAEWQGFQQHRSAYRDEMIKVFGGEPVEQSLLLHGKKGTSWIHVGPLDASVSSGQVWQIAREAQGTSMKAVTILSADFDTLSASE